VVWFASCSLWFESVWLLQSLCITIAYTISQAIGMFYKKHLGLSADGAQTLLLVPGILLGGWLSHHVMEASAREITMSLIGVPLAFIVGHIFALLLALIFSQFEQ
jgi:hypothetical protein